MIIRPVELFRISARRALFSLCFFKRNMPVESRYHDRSRKTENRILTNTKVLPLGLVRGLRQLEESGPSGIHRLFIFFAFTFSIMIASRQQLCIVLHALVTASRLRL